MKIRLTYPALYTIYSIVARSNGPHDAMKGAPRSTVPIEVFFEVIYDSGFVGRISGPVQHTGGASRR